MTFDFIDTETSEVHRGQIVPATRETLRAWLAERVVSRPAAFAVEGCTGWRFVVEELQRAGIEAHLAEPAETSARRGRKMHAKTDRLHARHLRQLLGAGDLPESWIPPEHVQETRTTVRLYMDLSEERTAWLQRVQATLFHHGLPELTRIMEADHRRQLEEGEGLSPAARQLVTVALGRVDDIDRMLQQLHRQLAGLSARQPGCQSLRREYGIGPITSVAIWAELGDCRRFSSSRDAVRHAGLDVTVHSSDGKRTRGHLSRQGPPTLRWALFEAAQCANRKTSPDRPYFLAVKERQGANRAALSVARRLVRRAHHRLRALGDTALAPVS
jgi:transposase